MDGSAKADVLKGKINALPVVDKTFTKEGCSADAKLTGERLEGLNNRLDNIDPGKAVNVAYDNTESGIDADQVQKAIDLLTALVKSGVVNKNFKIEKSSPALQLVNTAEERTGMVHYSNSSNLILSNQKDADNMVGIWVKPEWENPKDYLDLGTYIDGDFTRYPIFGRHNKPSGKYTGSGKTETKIINVGGVVGTTLKISTSKGMAIVTGAGAICKKYGSTEVYGLTAAACNFNDGVLTLETADEVVNGANVDYYYEVL